MNTETCIAKSGLPIKNETEFCKPYLEIIEIGNDLITASNIPDDDDKNEIERYY